MINIIKIGGNVIDSPENLNRFLTDFSKIYGKKILVHGGGKEATKLSSRLGIEAKMIEGRRVTDGDTIDIVTMVYAGLINKRIVALLQNKGVNAIGLCGADGGVIPANKRKNFPIDFGFVGDINPNQINIETLKILLDNNFTPVFCAITMCSDFSEGLLLNSNADSVASGIAIAASSIEPVVMHYCFEKNGVLSDIENEESVIQKITPETFSLLKKSGVVHSGMLPKIQNALNSIEAGVERVIIKSFKNLNSNIGTVVCKT